IAFGTEFANLGSFASGQIEWSILAVLAYAIPLLASFIVLYVKKTSLIPTALFAIAAILLFTMPSYTKTTITIINSVTSLEIDWVMSYGLIIATILSAFGFLLSLFMFVYKK
ncbi:MAG: hypothetical protein KJ847_06785, partial [Firmicutes bacterium]|nr:hypothetical protein [Bacillota bacterium]